MKKSHYFSILILAIIIAIPASVTRAEENDAINASVRVEMRKSSDDETSKREAKTLKEREIRALSTSTRALKDIPKEVQNAIKDVRTEAKRDINSATSSSVKRLIKERVNLDVFKIQHNRLIKQLEVALNNLKNIRDRLVSRIQKAEQSGRNMTEAKTLLTVADAKITAARQSVATLAGYLPTATTTATTTTATTTATTTVDLKKPREIGQSAIKAVKDAHKALIDVVRAIAKNMGRGGTGTTTPSISPTPTGTTTATTTP